MDYISHRGGPRGGGVQGVRTLPEMTCGFLVQLVFCKNVWFIGVEEDQETSAPPPKKNPGSAPEPSSPFVCATSNDILTL